MRNELHVEKLGKPVYNRILVSVIDTFDEFVSKGGVTLINSMAEGAWADSDIANITEYIMRHGVVVDLPDKVTSGSFDYDTDIEVKVGDIVYWNSISFKEHIPLVHEGKKYLLVDYHELLLRIRDDRITPVNGFALLRPIEKVATALAYTVVTPVTEQWEITHKPENLNWELSKHNKFYDIWEVGDIVHTMVRDMPFKLEGFINKVLKDQLYAVPLRMVLYSESTVEKSSSLPENLNDYPP